MEFLRSIHYTLYRAHKGPSRYGFRRDVLTTFAITGDFAQYLPTAWFLGFSGCKQVPPDEPPAGRPVRGSSFNLAGYLP
jgi:hypothetical protein